MSMTFCYILQGVCQKLAENKNVKTYRLPLEENIDIKTRRVLTVNHGKFAVLFKRTSLFSLNHLQKKQEFPEILAEKINRLTKFFLRESFFTKLKFGLI